MHDPELFDYFFVVDNEKYSSTEICTRGEGNEVMMALARVALLRSAEYQFARDRFHEMDMLEIGITLDVVNELVGDPYRSDPPSDSIKSLYVDAVELSGLMKQGIYGSLNFLHEGHFNTALKQVKEGVRSPGSYVDELIQDRKDRNIIQRNHSNWFDSNGYQMSYKRGDTAEDKGQKKLDLIRVTLQESKNSIDAASKNELFAALPKGAKAYKVRTVPFRKYKDGSINRKRPFIGGKMFSHNTYGYIEKDSEEFVPVMSVLSPEHPARQTPKK